DALALGRQVAEAVAAAHAKGIVHRDLKPSNVKLTDTGRVKVLDFGIARSVPLRSSGPDASSAPTLPLATAETAPGPVIGPPPDMSPEQARGKPVDAATDIWAIGCLLYEALTGTRAFAGETATDTIVAILHGQPDWTRLPPGTPAAIRDLLRRCLEKD